MPTNKTYDYDYEWTGQEEKPKGVVLQEKNPWNKPNWGNSAKPASPGKSSFAAQPDRFGMDELKRRHQWTTPAWATVKGKQQSATAAPTPASDDADIIKDPIPKPMLKQTAAGAKAGIKGASAGGGRWSAKTVAAAQAEIAAMEQQIAAAKQKKAQADAAAAAEQQAQEEQRAKHTVEETKLEKARRLAKEREEERWRATLAERNERDKAKREQARLAALAVQNSAQRKDDEWNQAHSEQQQRYEARVQQEALKRQQELEEAAGAAEAEAAYTAPSESYATISPANENDAGQAAEYNVNDEFYEEEIIEEEIVEDEYEEVDCEADEDVSAYPDELQRQIDALRLELASM
jgi:hypothetical protein